MTEELQWIPPIVAVNTMSPVAELEPVVNYVARNVEGSGDTISVTMLEGFGGILVALMHDIQRAESEYLQSSERDPAIQTAFEALFRRWAKAASAACENVAWCSVASSVQKQMGEARADANEAISELDAARRDMKLLADRYRNESW